MRMQNAGVVRLLRSFVRICGTQANAAKIIGVSPQFLHDVLNVRREPSGKILEYFNLERVVYFRTKS